jgi:transcriptional regulator GlxA family with amidase domain
MPTKFTFLILPHIHILDLAGADQAIHEAIDYDADFEIEYCGIGETVTTTSGLPFGAIPHYAASSLTKGDFLIIPGSAYTYLTSTNFLKNRGLFAWIRDQHKKGVNICSICMGAFVLAESGLLNHKNCTTHFKKTKELQERYPAIKVQENILFTEEEHIYTSAGIAAGIDLTLHIIEKLKGSHFAHLVARELVVYIRRNGDAAQESELLKFRNHIHAGIHQVQDFVLENIDKKTSLNELAEIANMSERNFTRIFRKETGLTVNEYITKIRVAKAVELQKKLDFSILEIANQVGLQSEKQLMRILNSKR